MTEALDETKGKELDKNDMYSEIVRLYQDEKDDKTMEEIGALFGVTKQRVQQIVKAAGVSYETKAQAKFNKSDLVKYHVEQKLGPKEIAEIYGCNQTTIIKYLEHYGIRRRYPQKNMNLTKEVLQDLFVNKRMSQTAIGREYGYVQSAVANLLKRHGITRG